MSYVLTYTCKTRIPGLLGVENFLNNYFTMYKRQTRSCIRVGVVYTAYLGLRIISIIILPIND